VFTAVLTRFSAENRVFPMKIAFIRRANAFFGRKSRSSGVLSRFASV
jgi:hypothetical protein